MLTEAVRTPDTQATLRVLAAGGRDVRALVNTGRTGEDVAAGAGMGMGTLPSADAEGAGNPPLLVAAQAGQLAQAELLMQNGANATFRDHRQRTAAQLAGEVSHVHARATVCVRVCACVCTHE
jgi:hypothetical protein